MPTSSAISKRILWISIGFISLIVGALYLPTFKFDFLGWDDTQYILQNPYLNPLSLSNTLQLLKIHIYWMPVSWLSHVVDVALFGFNAGAHHLHNVCWHILSTCLLTWLLHLLVRDIHSSISKHSSWWLCLGVSLCWALHPLRVEAVAWISDRKDLTCTFFYLATIISYLYYCKQPPPSMRSVASLRTVGLALLATASKPTAVTLPFTLILLDNWPLRRYNKKTITALLIEKGPFIGLAILLIVTTVIGQHAFHAFAPVNSLSLSQRVASLNPKLLFYIQKTLWPFHLSAHYPFLKVGWDQFLAIASSFIVFISLLGSWLLRKRYPALFICLTLYILLVFPMLGLTQVGRITHADRWTYLATIPVYGLFLSGCLLLLVSRYRTRVKPFVISLLLSLLMGLGLLTHNQLPRWQDSTSFWTMLQQQYPNKNAVTYLNLGDLSLKRGAIQESLTYYQKAIAIRPDYAGAHHNLAKAYLRQSDIAKAKAHFENAINLNPTFIEAYLNLGLLHKNNKAPDEAMTYYNKGLQLAPEHPKLHFNVAVIHFFIQKDFAQARTHLIYCLNNSRSLTPKEHAKAYYLLGLAHIQLNAPFKGLASLRRCWTLDPSSEHQSILEQVLVQLGTQTNNQALIEEAALLKK